MLGIHPIFLISNSSFHWGCLRARWWVIQIMTLKTSLHSLILNVIKGSTYPCWIPIGFQMIQSKYDLRVFFGIMVLPDIKYSIVYQWIKDIPDLKDVIIHSFSSQVVLEVNTNLAESHCFMPYILLWELWNHLLGHWSNPWIFGILLV